MLSQAFSLTFSFLFIQRMNTSCFYRCHRLARRSWVATNTGIIVIQLYEEIEIVQVSTCLTKQTFSSAKTRYKEELNRPGSCTAALI